MFTFLTFHLLKYFVDCIAIEVALNGQVYIINNLIEIFFFLNVRNFALSSVFNFLLRCFIIFIFQLIIPNTFFHSQEFIIPLFVFMIQILL